MVGPRLEGIDQDWGPGNFWRKQTNYTKTLLFIHVFFGTRIVLSELKLLKNNNKSGE